MSFMYTTLVMASVTRWSRRAAISSGCSTSRQLFMPIRTLFQTTGSVRRLLALVYTGPITSCYFRPFGAHDKDHQPVTRDFYQERQLYSEGLKCVCQLAGGTDDPLPSAVFMSRTVSNWCVTRCENCGTKELCVVQSPQKFGSRSKQDTRPALA